MILLTLGQTVFLCEKNGSRLLCDLETTPAFGPVRLGDELYYVPQNDLSTVVSGGRVINLRGRALGIALHQNNVYTLTNDGLDVIDKFSETVRFFPLAERVIMIASSGSSLLLANSSQLWHFNFENLCLDPIPLPAATHSIVLSPFGTICTSTGTTLVFKSPHVVVGSNEPRLESGKIFVPDGSTVVADMDLSSVPVLLPVSGQEIPTDCMVCMCEFEDEPSVTLFCGHVFHVDCIKECLKKSEEYCETGNHISFQSAKCPGGCGKIVTHSVAESSASVVDRKRKVEALARRQLKSEDPGKTDEDLLYYVCFRCNEPFFGGLRHCPRMMGKEPPKDPSELICESCARDFNCSQHGRMCVIYKCRFCCNPATNRCFGCYLVCTKCDARWTSSVPEVIPCDPNVCLLGGNHPEGSFAIGCGLCDQKLDWTLLINGK